MSPRPATIDDYRWLYANGYMPDGLKCAREIMLDIVQRCPATFLDVGCGRGELAALIGNKTTGRCAGWDPAFSATPDMPRAHAEWVISCDALEHVTPTELVGQLDRLARMASKGLLLTIANMSDVHNVNGEPVELHLIQKPADWWIDRLRAACPAGSRFTHRDINIHRFALIVEFQP